MNAATQVFSISELLELILLSLPCNTIHQETSSIRTIILGQTTCRCWHILVRRSTPLRKRLYYITPTHAADSKTWHDKHAFPPARPNPWIPNLLLNQRSWGSAWPFPDIYADFNMQPSQARFWVFSFEMSRAQYSRLPPPGTWRQMLVTEPAFTDFWYTRCFYELGSGRAPFVTHVDRDATLPAGERKYQLRCETGVTLGHICDAVSELFVKHPAAKFVLVESLRIPSTGKAKVEPGEDAPLTRT